MPRPLDARWAERTIRAVVSIPDLVQRPKADWDATGQDRLVWALIIVLVGLIGPILYLTVGRKKADPVTAGLASIVS